MSSLRWRFFLVTWPLVVLAVAGVALTFHRWTRVELDVLETAERGPPPVLPEAVAAAGRWLSTGPDGGAADRDDLARELTRIATEGEVDLAVLDGEGALVASTDTTLAVSPPLPATPGGPVRFTRTDRSAGALRVGAFDVAGAPVAAADGTVRGAVYALPRRGDEPLPAGEPLQARARRILWVAFLVASASAAALSLLLAGPLVGPIERLAEAAGRLRGGDLSVRVPPGGAGEVGRLAGAFNEMADELERADRHKRNVVSDVAHELRTPLTNVVGLLESVEDGLREPDARTMALIRAEAGLLVALVDDLQVLSLAESGQLVYDTAPVDVAEEARVAVEAARAGLGEAAPDVVGPRPDERVVALADGRRVGQVVRNLLRNALAHTPEGGGVRVEVDEIDDAVRIRVADTGAGIPADELPMIWERFHRVDASRSRHGGGRGLGLAIVRELAEGMGGSVSVHSTVGEGSAFEIRLPADAPDG